MGESKAYIALAETHEGICGSNKTGEKMKWVLFWQGYYWPTILKDCINYAKSYDNCKKHGPIQQVPTSELHYVAKPWPFRGWALDLIGQIDPPSSKGHRYILVAIDYFKKWVKAIPLKDVNQGDIINFIEQNIISWFGIPETLTTYQGIVFTRRKMVQFANSQNIKLLTSTLYYAQANSQVETINKILISLIKKHISQTPRSWHETLNQVLCEITTITLEGGWIVY